MIQSIEIENFRCFHQTKLEGFKRVNLIGGQNNAGKTALLEAVYLSCDPEKIIEIMQMRGEFLRDKEANADRYKQLFNNLNAASPMSVSNGRLKTNITNFKLQSGAYPDGMFTDIAILGIEEEGISLQEPLTNPWEMRERTQNIYKVITNSQLNQIEKSIILSEFIHSSTQLKGYALIKSYEQRYLNEEDSFVQEALTIFIPMFESIRPISYENTLYIKTKGNKPLPISMFGDAVNRMAEFVLRIIEARGGVVLIDEIENGIHYSHHKEVWSALFKLAKLFDVQLFATSHSLEMIRAFNEVAMTEGFEEDAQYIEMFRSARSGEIVGNVMTLETLAYSLRTGKTFRGE